MLNMERIVNCLTGEISEFADQDVDTILIWDHIRIHRNTLLLKSDWTQLSDAPVDNLKWAVYRQALRDITTQEDPFNIIWPQEP